VWYSTAVTRDPRQVSYQKRWIAIHLSMYGTRVSIFPIVLCAVLCCAVLCCTVLGKTLPSCLIIQAPQSARAIAKQVDNVVGI